MVAALFVRKTSHYKDIPGVDCYDEDRNALNFQGGTAGVYHPPCRGWGKLRHMAKIAPNELELARWSMRMVRQFGGVVEHPSSSLLWAESGCLGFGIRDDHGGILIPVLQSWWGHRAPKQTSLYMVGVNAPSLLWPEGLPPVPSGLVENMCKAERERTPFDFAQWLIDLAKSVEVTA